MTEIIGWASSLVLLLTLVKQVHKQWTDKTSEGISMFLFIGQVLASVGFTVYSVLLGNWVFIVTNCLLVINSIFGICFYFYYRKKK